MEDTSTSGIRIEKLSEHNFHARKQKIVLVLGHRDVDEIIDSLLFSNKPLEIEAVQKWVRKDKTDRMTIGLTLSDEMLKNVSHNTTALEMWTEICNVHQRHTLFNKLSARRDFNTATMQDGEKMFVYLNRIRQMASILKSMDVSIDDKKMGTAVLNGLPSRFETIITAMDAIVEDETSFIFYKVRSRLLQEEKRYNMCSKNYQSEKPSALMNKTSSSGTGNMLCTHCGRTNHTEPYCWKKHGRPSSKYQNRSGRPLDKKEAEQGGALETEASNKDSQEDSDGDYVCLVADNSKNDNLPN